MQIDISILDLEAFLLVMFRVSGILFFAPILGGKPVPMVVKAGISLWVALIFFQGIDPAYLPLPSDALSLMLATVGELMIGMIIGLIAQIISVSVQYGGHVLGTHMGIRIANVFDPSTEVTTTLLGGFLNVVVVLILLSLDFHLILVRVVAESYDIIPPLGVRFHIGIVEVLLRAGSNIFVFAVQIVAPVLAAIFFVEVIIAVLAKTARQFNMLMLQFPIKIIIGSILLPIIIFGLPNAVKIMLRTVLDQIGAAINFMGP